MNLGQFDQMYILEKSYLHWPSFITDGFVPLAPDILTVLLQKKEP